MPGTWNYAPPRRIRRGAALTMVFAGVLATGAANSWGEQPSGPASEPTDRAPDAAAGPAQAERQAGAARDRDQDEAAERLVSRSGDRWSAAYTAREYAGLERTLDGEYVGVGISVRYGLDGAGRRTVEVARVQAGSPAAEAGIRAGDRLHGVDGTEVDGRPVTEVVALLRGSDEGSGRRGPRSAGGKNAKDSKSSKNTKKSAEGGPRDGARTQGGRPGTAVALDLSRDGRSWDASVRRARLTSGTVTTDKLSVNVTKIKITRFTEESGERVRNAVRHIPDGTGILLDLRGNSGGLVTEAAEAASALLDGGLVGTYDDGGVQRALYAKAGGDTESPVVVLVDSGTMSAAELVTGALQDRGRAVVVGSRTFGKGSVQVPRHMADGSVAELTVGDYATPSGRAVDNDGLPPDLAVPSGGEAESRARTVLSGLTAGS